jgi:methylisocitrate lyase
MLLSSENSNAQKIQRLRDLIVEKTVVMPGAFNAPVGMMAQSIGFEAIYISGAGLINGTAGYPDIALLGMDEMVREASYIANAVDVPAICDADTGYGDVLQVMRTIQAFERAGLAGVHLEDQEAPKRCGHLDGKSLISVAEMERKLAAAVEARQNPDFLIVARTDARSVEGFDESVERGLRYVEAGADAIFPEALLSEDEFGRYAQKVAVPLMANMTEFGKTPYLSASQFTALGYSMVIFPMSAFRVMMKAVEELLRQLKVEGSAESFLPRMQTRQQLYDLLGYADYETMDAQLAARYPA